MTNDTRINEELKTKQQNRNSHNTFFIKNSNHAI